MDKQKPPLLTVSMTCGDDSVSISRPVYTDDGSDGSVEVGQVIGHARTAPKPATTPMGSTYEPGRASSFFDDERWDGIENGN